ncbi:MAG: hypothetical protein NWQ55_00030 [Salibacteraceae bacterium]|jgi:hypothetical protein|nr:hypothetical protein [Salibacteraceae bacterium]MDP4685352.1 hypothetical protein [Salibacteraceae bacterium]MDP4764229.1 hypothetical protein [Salibacteraceae bacterium]MDP4845533.1 hypothetical protein [Salibacteraceae bacterium]MDP4963422.1 hypothetical protein [Salibacteraceae bacterium]
MNTKLILLGVALLTVVFSANAQEIAPDAKLKIDSKHMIGLAAGTSGGLGVMYAFNPNRFTFQAVAFPNMRPDDAYLHAGLNFHYDVENYRYFDLFLFQNNRLVYDRYKYSDYDYNTGETYTVKRENYSFAHSAGLGLNFEPLDHFGFNFMSGFAVYNYNQISMCIDAAIFFRL